jgi:hypothetical protein
MESQPKIFTSNYWRYKGEGRVAISRSSPRNAPAGFKIYRALAPGTWFNKPPYCDDEAVYRERYETEILKPLNATQVYADLLVLTDGHPPVLLCWEDVTKEGQWCHRRMAAAWFERELGFSVPEYEPILPQKSRLQLPLFDVVSG